MKAIGEHIKEIPEKHPPPITLQPGASSVGVGHTSVVSVRSVLSLAWLAAMYPFQSL